MIKTSNSKFYIFISVWMTFTLIQGHSFIRSHKYDVHFLANLDLSLDEIQYVTTTC